MPLNAQWAVILIKWCRVSQQEEELGEMKDEVWDGARECPSVQPLPGVWCSLKLTAACECVKDGDEVVYLTKTSNRRFCRGFIALAKWWMNRTNQIWLFENGTGKGSNFTELVLGLSNNTLLPPPFLRSAGKGCDSVSPSLQMEMLRHTGVQCLVPCHPAGKEQLVKVLPLRTLSPILL